jgi:hypothetical protein
MSPQTVAKLYNEFEEIIAIKEATGSLDIASEILSLCDITVLSGDDSLTLPLMAVGGKGVISVLSNLSPKMVKAITAPALEGNFAEARIAHLKTVCYPPHTSLRIQPGYIAYHFADTDSTFLPLSTSVQVDQEPVHRTQPPACQGRYADDGHVQRFCQAPLGAC